MSDIHTKLLMGTTISAVSIMLVMAIGISSEQKNEASGNAVLGLLGHFEIMVVNPDGSASYVQADNFVTGAAKTDIAELLFLGNAIAGVYDCTLLGTNVAALTDASGNIGTALGTTGLACGSDDGAVPDVTCDGLGSTTVGEICTITTEHTLGTDCDPSCVLTEVEIGTGTTGDATLGARFAYTELDADITANFGANATVTYKVSTGGTIPA